MGRAYSMHEREEKSVQGFGGKAWRKVTSRKTKAYVGGWDQMDLRETGWGVWIGFIWLRIGTSGNLLWMQWWTFRFLCHSVSKHLCMSGSISVNLFSKSAFNVVITMPPRLLSCNLNRFLASEIWEIWGCIRCVFVNVPKLVFDFWPKVALLKVLCGKVHCQKFTCLSKYLISLMETFVTCKYCYFCWSNMMFLEHVSAWSYNLWSWYMSED
jgi:hypothetical protein